jgi:hypothetical protein
LRFSKTAARVAVATALDELGGDRQRWEDDHESF